MSKRSIIGLSALLLVIAAAELAQATEPEPTIYKSDELIVRFDSTLSPAQQDAIVSSLGACCIKHRFNIVPGLVVVTLSPELTVQEAMQAFKQADGVLYAEPNYKHEYTATFPNDPRFNKLWGLHNTGQSHPVGGGGSSSGTADADIDAPEAWDTHTGNSNIVVAVTDTGIDYTHPDLTGNMWINSGEDKLPLGLVGPEDYDGVDDDNNGYIDDVYGYDFAGPWHIELIDPGGDPDDPLNQIIVWDGPDSNPIDGDYHGTHVSGTIGAIGNNGVGVVGVCWNVRLMALKIFPDGLEFTFTFTSLEVESIEYAVKNGANIINASWGGLGHSQALKDAIDAADSKGVLFVAAAGNENNNNDLFASYPNSYNSENIISVMATDHDDNRSVFSNWGPGTVDIAAPGTDILSTFPTYQTLPMQSAGFSTYYETISGTSMAAPHVAGAAALLWAAEPSLSHIEVKCRLLEYTDRVFPPTPKLCLSNGRLNINKALAATTLPKDYRFVPSQYPTIEAAVTAAHDGDWIIVSPGVHYVESLEGISFSGKTLRLMSEDPEDPDVVASTIIDCQNRGRAFYFCCGEDANSVVDGFTIRNGHAAGARGIDGLYLGPPTDPEDPESPLTANWGEDVTGDGKGGAIYCEWGSSPTISNCVITNCTASGAIGGNGFNGVLIPDGSDDPGQWGGAGGWAWGDGYGGAIFCGNDSNPIISNCIFTGNTAMGPIGGNGGNGSINLADTSESWGGNGGWAWGDGYGGAIACDANSSPTLIDCILSGNTAIHGTGGTGGLQGNGSDLDPPAQDGFDGFIIGAGYGGAAYYASHSTLNFTNVTVSGNIAYQYKNPDFPLFDHVYNDGGGIYCVGNSAVTLINCTVEDNTAGGLYSGEKTALTLTDCTFANNTLASNGGGLYSGPGGTATADGCTFSGNSTTGNGGGMHYVDSDFTLSNCTFGGNSANGDGGGVYSYGDDVVPTITVHNSIFTNNNATWGGGVAWDHNPLGDAVDGFDATVTDSFFIGNTAVSGAGLYWEDSSTTTTMSGCLISENSASGNYGGGIYCSASPATISDSTISNNAVLGEAGSGGGINIYGGAATKVSNCLLTANFAVSEGSAISCNIFSEAEITLCTISEHTTGGDGGGIYCDKYSTATVSNCIFDNCRKHAIYEQGNFYGMGDVDVIHSLFHSNQDGDFFDEGTTSYTGKVGINTNVSPTANTHNNEDGHPLYVTGDLGGFYLNLSSPAVDTGSGTAANLGMNLYTTRTDNAPDSGTVDMGYHHPIPDPNLWFDLTTSVVEDEFGDRHGSVEPASGTYYLGTIVTLTAQPDAAWRMKQWSGGTVDDSSLSRINSVLMNDHKHITVEFEQGRLLEVGPDGDYANIQSAIHDANDGDTILVDTGTWFRPEYAYNVNKSIVITSMNPDNPVSVANTIIDGSGYAGPKWFFGPDTDEGTILNGFTIQNSSWGTLPIDEPGDREAGHPNGYDGGCSEGGLIYVYRGGSPIIKNCVIQDSSIWGGLGGDGVDATEFENAGRGGWGGWARGGAIYCEPGSGPTFLNCQILNNQVIAGTGGDGGNEVIPGGAGNYGGLWSRAEYWNIIPTSLTLDWEPGDLWRVWQWDFAAYYYLLYGLGDGFSYIGDYRWYSGYGGGVFCDEGSKVTFIDCTISGNLAQGGVSGIGGISVNIPSNRYEIPSFGGGVYCAADSKITFTRCTFADNISSEPTFDHTVYDDGLGAEYDPLDTYRLDPYLGHGAGVCAERTASLVFTDCLLGDNTAAVGGGLYWTHTNPIISDCNFVDNSAFIGGGLASIEGSGTIIGSNIKSNEAVATENEEEVLGDGAGVHCWGTNIKIIDSDISDNIANGAGGGVYLGGGDYESFTLKLHNCLIANNTSVINGGGVSCNWFSEPNIVNCTISDNIAEPDPVLGGGHGGGLFCSYNSNANILNSIIWGNTAPNTVGKQMWIGSGDVHDPEPSTVTVSYSNIQGGQADILVEPGCTLNWGNGNLEGTGLDNPLFVEGYFLSQPSTGRPGQSQLSPCVDAGIGEARLLPLGRYRYTTRTDNGDDLGDIDMSFHYRKRGKFVDGDITYSGEVTFDDVLLLLEYWLAEGCDFPDWCEGTDINKDGTVNNVDYGILTQLYGMGDTMAPVPDPSTWRVPPISRTMGSVYMKAALAADNSGEPVQYYFDCVLGPGRDSGWQDSPEYEDGGLQDGTEYGYRVRARDVDPQYPGKHNETEWSAIGYAVVGEDTIPPTPNPSGWQTDPYATGPHSIQMAAETASDPSGVEYYFECTFGLTYGGDDSGWQDSPIYEDIGLEAARWYCYSVKTRDKSMNNNQTGWSEELCAQSLSEPDLDPPAPLGWADVDGDGIFEGMPREYSDGNGYYYHTMSAEEAFDDSGVVLYKFESLCGAVPDSDWQAETTYTRLVSYTGSVPCCYRILVKDAYDNTAEMPPEEAACTY